MTVVFIMIRVPGFVGVVGHEGRHRRWAVSGMGAPGGWSADIKPSRGWDAIASLAHDGIAMRRCDQPPPTLLACAVA